MTGIKVSFEIGHAASLRSKKTPEGFTHDWEVFVRGQEGADISHFVDKVVFQLHETFKKPRRVVKEPPFSIKESGYAGFMFPIEIYLKNKDEPKKIIFSYDFTLQQSGCLKDRYVFQNPNEEFRKKLLKGGGIPVTNNAFYTNPEQESRSRDSFTEERQQLVSKPKLSTENGKKHKSKEPKEEIPHRTSSFENLFGPPIQKPPKVSDKVEKPAIIAKPEKKEKERSSSEKKSKHEHKDIKPEKLKVKEEKEKVRSEKVKTHSKDQEKSKDKANKRPSERPPSPEATKKRCVSPIRRAPSPPPRSSSASSIKEEYKSIKHNIDNIEQKKPKPEEKPMDAKAEKDVKEKKKKEKKSHDRDKQRKDKKEHKKESHRLKESPKEPLKEILKESLKIRDIPKEREQLLKDSPTVKEKSIKPDKPLNKFSLENLRKTPENEERIESHKIKEKSEVDRRHKHKKKDKKRDESKEKHKESSKEKKHKHDKIRDTPQEKPEIIEHETPVPKERPPPEPASPISIDTASQCSSKSGLTKSLHVGNEDANSSHSDSESSVVADEEEAKVKIENLSPEPITIKHEPSPEPDPEPEPEPDLEPEIEPQPEPIVEPPPPVKEKSKKHKDKSAKREERRRKRKAAEEEMENLEDVESRKLAKVAETGPSFNDLERGESSGSTSVETKVQDNGVSSSLGEDAEPGDLSPDYMVQLRELQQRIMKIKNNEELERVVNLIAETGRYEVTTQTFDFDLCLLDRSTVKQLIQLVGC